VCKTDLPKYITTENNVHELFPFSLQSESFLLLETVSQKDLFCYIAPLKAGEDAELTIGRNEDNDLTMFDSSISRRHAYLEISDGRMDLMNDNSKYGTLLELRRDLLGLKRVILVRDRFVFKLSYS